MAEKEITNGEWRAGDVETEEMTFKGPYVGVYAGGALLFFDGLVAVVGGRDKKQTKANAKLIAASPKLLAASQIICQNCQNECGTAPLPGCKTCLTGVALRALE